MTCNANPLFTIPPDLVIVVGWSLLILLIAAVHVATVRGPR